MILRHFPRLPLIASALLILLAALWAGLLRMGWIIPPIQPLWIPVHGPLMVCGFLGVVISLERAAALSTPTKQHPRGLRWSYAGPIFTALGGLILLIGLQGWMGPLLITLGSVGLVAIFVVIVRREPAPYTVTMALGAGSWLIGNALWLAGQPVYNVVAWWLGFLILTVVGERLELSRLLKLSSFSRTAFLVGTAIFGVGLILVTLDRDWGMRLVGVGEIALALWLLRYDIARYTVRRTGLTRFIALSLLLGYVWLGVGGVLTVLFGGVMGGPLYDAVLHTVFVGFVFSMIFGHAPMILPALLKLPVAYQQTFYIHLGLLHLSLVLRIVGDLTEQLPLRQWGGMFNAIALTVFLANTAITVWNARRQANKAVVPDAPLLRKQDL